MTDDWWMEINGLTTTHYQDSYTTYLVCDNWPMFTMYSHHSGDVTLTRSTLLTTMETQICGADDCGSGKVTKFSNSGRHLTLGACPQAFTLPLTVLQHQTHPAWCCCIPVCCVHKTATWLLLFFFAKLWSIFNNLSSINLGQNLEHSNYH